MRIVAALALSALGLAACQSASPPAGPPGTTSTVGATTVTTSGAVRVEGAYVAR